MTMKYCIKKKVYLNKIYIVLKYKDLVYKYI